MISVAKRVVARRFALLGATILAGTAAPAFAQAAAEPADAAQAVPAPAEDQAPAAGTDIVVTGSRIQNGNNLPTPVTVVSTQLLQATTPASIPDGLNKLPAFNSTSTPNNAVNANGRGFGTPGNFLNLRGLSPIRTLILQDGNRVPGTFFDTTVDTNMLPQLLISRVEVVTGGASAVYGSDAVTGVVNFITDNKFVGLKGLLQGGISDYGDAISVRGGLAWGTKIGDRGHLELSAEYYKRNGIDDTASRPYGNLYPAVVGAGTAASPFTLVYGARQSNASEGGLVRTGPFAGMQFLPDGSLARSTRAPRPRPPTRRSAAMAAMSTTNGCCIISNRPRASAGSTMSSPTTSRGMSRPATRPTGRTAQARSTPTSPMRRPVRRTIRPAPIRCGSTAATPS